jgi:hypothetical protein
MQGRSVLVAIALTWGCGGSDDGAGAVHQGSDAGTSTGGVSTGGVWAGGAGASTSGGSGGNAGATGQGGGAGSGGGDFTADGCFKWTEQVSLQTAVTDHDCVEIQPGTYTLKAGVAVAPGHTVRGVSAAESILKASQSDWSFNCCDSLLSDTLPQDPETNPFRVEKLTLDGAGVATYNVCCRGFVAESTILKNSRCSAIGAAGKGVVAKANQMLNSAQATDVPGKGLVSCASGGFDEFVGVSSSERGQAGLEILRHRAAIGALRPERRPALERAE